jgi:hypothetical protein
MKARLLLIPAIVATTAAVADTRSPPSIPMDAHMQAAALLSGSHTSAAAKARTQERSPSLASAAGDAHARAAALLSPRRAEGPGETPAPVDRPSGAWGDAHAQAAALLSGSRISTGRSLAEVTNRT